MSNQQEIIDRIERDLAELKKKSRAKPVTLEDIMERLDAIEREIASIPRYPVFPWYPCTRPHYPPHTYPWTTVTSPTVVWGTYFDSTSSGSTTKRIGDF